MPQAVARPGGSAPGEAVTAASPESQRGFYLSVASSGRVDSAVASGPPGNRVVWPWRHDTVWGIPGARRIVDDHVHSWEGTSEAHMAATVEWARHLGIRMLVSCLTPDGMSLTSDERSSPPPPVLRACNEETAMLMARYPDVVLGLCYVNPVHPEASEEEMERWLGHGGFAGLKLWVAARA